MENDALTACKTTPRSPWIMPSLPRLPARICTSPALAMRPLFWRLLTSSCTSPLPASVPPWVKVPPILPWNKPPADIVPPVLSTSVWILNRTARPTPAPAQRLAPKAEQRQAVSYPHEPKFPIHKIEILGVTKLTKQQIRKIAGWYENRSLGASDINVLLEALTRAYVHKGYITTRIYLPEQNIPRGVLKLQVLEGRLASFATSTLRKSQLFTAFPTQPGAIIRLPDLEQGMDQLERPGSVRA